MQCAYGVELAHTCCLHSSQVAIWDVCSRAACFMQCVCHKIMCWCMKVHEGVALAVRNSLNSGSCGSGSRRCSRRSSRQVLEHPSCCSDVPGFPEGDESCALLPLPRPQEVRWAKVLCARLSGGCRGLQQIRSSTTHSTRSQQGLSEDWKAACLYHCYRHALICEPLWGSAWQRQVACGRLIPWE